MNTFHAWSRALAFGSFVVASLAIPACSSSSGGGGGTNPDAGTGSSVTTQGGTVSLTGNVVAQSLTVTCPDGSEYVGYARDLGSCDAGVPSFNVGSGGGQSADGGPSPAHVGVSLNDTGAAGGTTVVFDCAN